MSKEKVLVITNSSSKGNCNGLRPLRTVYLDIYETTSLKTSQGRNKVFICLADDVKLDHVSGLMSTVSTDNFSNNQTLTAQDFIHSGKRVYVIINGNIYRMFKYPRLEREVKLYNMFWSDVDKYEIPFFGSNLIKSGDSKFHSINFHRIHTTEKSLSKFVVFNSPSFTHKTFISEEEYKSISEKTILLGYKPSYSSSTLLYNTRVVYENGTITIEGIPNTTDYVLNCINREIEEFNNSNGIIDEKFKGEIKCSLEAFINAIEEHSLNSKEILKESYGHLNDLQNYDNRLLLKLR